MRTSRKYQQGVMMIEALVGILIFSFGILAMMGLQAISIKNMAESKYRTEASFIANEIIGTMWTECGGTTCTLSSYDTTSGGTNAKRDAWQTEVVNKLPRIGIGVSDAPLPTIVVAGNTVTVTVYWKIPGTDDSSPPRQFRTIAQINAS